MPKSMLQNSIKENAKERRSKQTALLHAPADVEGVRRCTVKLNDIIHVEVKGLDHAERFARTSNLSQNLEQAISTDEIEGFRRIDKCHIQGLSLLSAFFLATGARGRPCQ